MKFLTATLFGVLLALPAQALDIRQSTATEVLMGPFYDVTDKVTPENALSVTAFTCTVTKQGGTTATSFNPTASAGNNDMVFVTSSQGTYRLEMTATNTDTVGRMRVHCIQTAEATPAWLDLDVLTQAEWDAKYSTGSRNAAVVTWNGTPLSSTNPLPTADAGASGGLPIIGTGDNEFKTTSGNVTLAAVTHTGAVIPTVSAITGDTKQTGDNFVRLGAPNGASVSADILTSIGLLLQVQGSGFVEGTDSLEAIRDRGDAAWTTGAGTGLTPLASGTAQAGDPTHITLAAGSSAVDNFYVPNAIKLVSGTGAGQCGQIKSYDGTGKIAEVYDTWRTNPASDTVYEMTDGTCRTLIANTDITSTGGPIQLDANDRAVIDVSNALGDGANLTGVGGDGSQLTLAGGDGSQLTVITGAQTTAQDDLDLLTGADGATLAASQPNYDAPTNTELNARTLPSASYFDPAADTVTVGALNTAAKAEVQTEVEDGIAVTLEQHALVDAQVYNCEVNTAFTSPATASAFACIVTDRDGNVLTLANSRLRGSEIQFRTGALAGDKRHIFSSTWDATNSELVVTVGNAFTAAPADGVIAIIK